MLSRSRSSFLFLAVLAAALCHRAGGAESAVSPSADNSPAAEARRLYDHANDYVARISEGDYSYAYMQFYWKRSQGNIDRVLRVYPDTPTGRALKSGELKLGSFETGYFRDRVLARLEEKRQAAVDAIKCSIFLCEIRGDQWNAARVAGLTGILEALCRQQRWGEALQFQPVRDSDRFLKLSVIFRVAARYGQQDIVRQLLATTADQAELTQLHAIQGEALALRGVPRTEIAALLDQDSADAVKLAVLGGMTERETQIQRAAALRLSVNPKDGINAIHYALKNLEVRDDVDAVARTFFPGGNAAADELLATYRSGLGAQPPATAAVGVHLAYLHYLAVFEKFDELGRYLSRPGLSAAVRQGGELKLIELYALTGRMAESERHRTAYAAAGGESAEAAALAQFRGQISCMDPALTVHPTTLAALPFEDPAVLAQAIMEWSLTPNRSIRGAAPYDAVVQKFAPGFANLAAPKSNAVRDAASTQKPF